MNRFEIYGSLLLISLLMLILIGNTSVDTIIFILFTISSITLLFSTDTPATNQEELKKPEVFNYFINRNDNYQYAIITLFVFTSLLFALLSSIWLVRLGVAVIICWAIATAGTIFISKYFSPKDPKENLRKYLKYRFHKGISETDKNIDHFVDLILSIDLESPSDEANLKILEKEGKVEQDIGRKILAEYFGYIQSNEVLSPDEIRAINDNKPQNKDQK